MIDENLLLEYKAKIISLKKDDNLFYEGDRPTHYYQIKEGSIKVSNYSDDGKEFVQGIFSTKESLGEPPLFGEFGYPGTACVIVPSLVFAVRKEHFKKLLKENFTVQMKLLKTLSKRLHYKAMIMREISSYDPEHRILSLIDYLKKKDNVTTDYKVSITRQQIANLTGLRVETVIRAIKQLEEKKELEIRKRQVYR